jgi:ribonucleoside-diphosphate reductase alpha chain
METGEPYLMFEDAVQNALPDFQKRKGLQVHHSNLCSEITLATDEERTAVCCLSSVNLEYYDEWKNHPAFIPDLIRMLDNVLESFIEKAPSQLEKAKFSAYRERSIGLGAMGFHAHLQKNNIPFESAMANQMNLEMFEYIKSNADMTTRELALERGACPDDDTASVRNAHLLAIAPNASSSILCGNTSPSIEPFRANAYTQKTKSGSNLVKNKYLDEILMSKIGHTDLYEDTWKSIIANRGSVQHLDILDDWEKDVFKTAVEINQAWLIEHASQRQQFICQSQSLNLFFPPDVNKGDLHNIHMLAWAKNIKTLYYLRSEAISRADNVTAQAKREIIFENEDCLSCEG